MELDRTREEPLLDVKERLEVDEAREEPLLVHEDEALVRHLLETRATPSWMPLLIVASAGIALSADVPLLPAMMARFGKGPRGVAWWVGVAQGCYSAAQFVSSPLIGHCSDVRGRRPFVLGALATSCAATLLCGFASSAAQVVGLRVLAGLTNNNVALARALVAEAPAATAGARGALRAPRRRLQRVARRRVGADGLPERRAGARGAPLRDAARRRRRAHLRDLVPRGVLPRRQARTRPAAAAPARRAG